MKDFMKNRRIGFYLSLAAAVLAVVGAIAFVAVYQLTAGTTVDRVFKWLTFGFILGGGVVALAGEAFRLRVAPVLAAAALGVGFANHLCELAYPLADVLTGVPFFGGNFTLGLIFAIIFGAAVILTVVAAFMEHNK